MKFSHLHVHTQYSLLDGASDIKSLVKKAVNDKMPALAITDHGNLFGVFEFVAETYKLAKSSNHAIKPIIGCEFYMTEDVSVKDKSVKAYHQLLLAKNDVGYRNLLALSHYSYVEGFYRKPMIDKKKLLAHKEGLIATSCCLAGLVARSYFIKGEVAAEEEIKWWLDVFGEDYYLEMQRHDLEEQNIINIFLQRMAKKYNIKLICTNDSHYTEQEFEPFHEILLCINTGSVMTDPKKTEESSSDEVISMSVEGGKKVHHRFAFPNGNFFFKTTKEMEKLFNDIPEAVDQTNEIVDKVEALHLERDVMLPLFSIPEGFSSQHAYLRHLAEHGLRNRYQEITPLIRERFEFELGVIEKMEYSGYFLIVADFIQAAKTMGIAVGPGRGSAAGSLVAYTIGITNIDPIKYNLLFERFLNPERRGMPDIDVDFDDIGRGRVIDYIVKKYGRDHTAQIITFNTMGAKQAFKDVARVLSFNFQESNQLSKLLSGAISIKQQIEEPIDVLEKEGIIPIHHLERLKLFRESYEKKSEIKKIVDIAHELEGSVRNVGVHAAGMIIAPQPVQTMIPVCMVKENPMLVTQIDGVHIEKAGVIKMDILGLSNLSTIQKTLKLIREHNGKDINIDEIPLDDERTFQLYQRAETIGTFQFESDGMRKYLQDLKPDCFEDLIALNALYRPGPMRYIPEYILRKQGKKQVSYDLPEMELFLKETYGITVYQEQVMLIAQKIANFSKGEADVLRKAMGKKDPTTLQKLKENFLKRAEANGHPRSVLQKIWTDWESFAQYAFNKSHSTCYAYVAYQTAYLKANYPHEYMVALLEGAGDIKALSKLMQETRRMGLIILGPSVQESGTNFSVNEQGIIRFGLSSIKGFGIKDSEYIVQKRQVVGGFKDIFHFMQSMEGSLGVGKLEALVKAGALDVFSSVKRSQYFAKQHHSSFLEQLTQYSKAHDETPSQKTNYNQLSLFSGESNVLMTIPKPQIPTTEAEEWNTIQLLKNEREVLGMYISSHPLVDYEFEFEKYGFTTLSDFSHLEDNANDEDDEHSKKIDHTAILNSSFLLGGIVEEVQERISKRGSPYISLSLSDFTHTYSFTFFGNDFSIVKKIAVLDSYIFLLLGFEKDRFNSQKIKSKLIKAGRLEDIRLLHTKEIHFYIRQNHLSPELTSVLSKHMETKQGTSILYLHLAKEDAQQTTIQFPRSIVFDDDLLSVLQQNSNLYCKVKPVF